MKYNVNKILNSKQYRALDIFSFLCAGIMSCGVMFVLFYRQAISDGITYMSDIGPYIEEMLGTQSKYSFPYPILFKTAGLIYSFLKRPEISMVIAIVFFNAIAIIVTKIIYEKESKTYLISTFAVLCLFFLSMIYSKKFAVVGINNAYEGVFSPNPWHNATYMAARPFMILTFYFGARVLKSYEVDFQKGNDLKSNIKIYILFMVSLLLSTLAKPSYTIVHIGAAGIIMLFRLIKHRFLNIRQTLLAACFYIPTFIVLLIQFGGVFARKVVTGGEQGIGVAPFKIWSLYTQNIPVAIILACFFPFVVLVVHRKDLFFDYQYRFSWYIYISGVLMAIIFFEKGFRATHGNFFWGYICGLFIVFFESILLLLKDTRNALENVCKFKNRLILLIEWISLIIHTVMGLHYFQLLCYGNNYS